MFIISSTDTLLQGMSFSVTCQMKGHALSVFAAFLQPSTVVILVLQQMVNAVSPVQPTTL